MAGLRFSLFLLPLLSQSCLSHVFTQVETCPTSFCKFSETPIMFPFGLTHQQNQSCIHPGFNLSCDDSGRTVINLPKSGEFVVTFIDYQLQTILLEDPQGCLPKRLQTFSTSGSPFRAESYMNLTFLNCSAGITTLLQGYKSIPCLGNGKWAIFIKQRVHVGGIDIGIDLDGGNPCEDVWSTEVPSFSDVFRLTSLNPSIRLMWDRPACGWCGDNNIGRCRMKDQNTLEVTCDIGSDDEPNHGSWGMVSGVIIIVVLKSGFLCCIWWRRRRAAAASRRGRVSIPAAMAPSRHGQVSIPAAMAPVQGQAQQQQQLSTDNGRIPMGMDSPALASYPKIKITENMTSQLCKSGDGDNNDTCAICLMDYRINDTIKIISGCDHYFHDYCLDNWLRTKATCPLCRKQQPHSTASK